MTTHEVHHTTLYTIIHIWDDWRLVHTVYVHRSEYRHWDA